jgi:DNA-binding NarL/FixJ family response regulator
MTKLLIYEDNTQLREGLSILINGSNGFEVLASFKNCDNVLHEVEAFRPDVILMDIDMPGTDGIEGLKILRQHNKDVKVLMLTVFDDNERIFESLKNGANGYLLKKTSPSKLLEYIQEANSGGSPMSSTIASQVLKMFSDIYKPASNVYNLSTRENEVLQYLVNGYSYKMIAAELTISIDTVRGHIKNIYEKMHVNSKTEAVAKAFKSKIF